MIKPDAVKNHHTGDILARIEKEGFRILGFRLLKMSVDTAKKFYEVHKERPFYNDLCNYMSSGPVVVIGLERENAVQHWRDVIGATDPAQAAPGTIRKLYAVSKEANAAHGSDSVDNGKTEIAFFFKSDELVG